MKCPHCGQEHPDEARFCPSTGQPIVLVKSLPVESSMPVEDFRCPRCEQVVQVGAIFCPSCGLRLLPDANPRPRRWLWPTVLGIGYALVIVGLIVTFWPKVAFLFTPNNPPGPTPNRLTQIQPGTPALAETQPAGKGSSPTASVPSGSGASATPSQTSTLLPAAASASPWGTAASASPWGITATWTATRTATPSPTPEIANAPACTSTGQTWMRPTDKAEMACVPAGSFVIGQKSCGYAGCEKEVSGGSVNLKAFWMDRSEVTNAQFALFVAATGFQTGAERTGASAIYESLVPVSGANWRSPQGAGSTINGKMDHPVVQMNWYSANAYCQWVGGLLPTEAQWEKAARGTDGRLFPWGNDLPDDFLLNAADSTLPAPHSRKDKNDGFRYTSPVGQYPDGDSPYGIHDLAGNAWEWTRSFYKDYPYIPTDGREISADPGVNDLVVLKGGCWYDDYGSVRSTLRYGGPAQRSTDGTGFRCVLP